MPYSLVLVLKRFNQRISSSDISDLAQRTSCHLAYAAVHISQSNKQRIDRSTLALVAQDRDEKTDRLDVGCRIADDG